MNGNSDTYILDFPIKREVIDFYNSEKRHYHNLSHIEEMLTKLKSFRHKLDNKQYWSMALAIIFHDVYQNGDSYNSAEKLSFKFAKEHLKEFYRFYSLNYDYDINLIERYIMTTDYTNIMFNRADENLMIYLDLSRFLDSNKKSQQMHIDILKEFPQACINSFRNMRSRILRDLSDSLQKVKTKEFYGENFDNIISGIDKSIDILKSMTFNIGVYPGSFNPLHKGHKDIIKQAEKVFDKVILIQAQNPDKENPTELDAPYKVYSSSGYIGKIFDEISKENSGNISMIRGLRNANDLQYEMDYKQNLNDLGFNYGFVYFISNPTVRHISSTGIRNAENMELDTEQWK